MSKKQLYEACDPEPNFSDPGVPGNPRGPLNPPIFTKLIDLANENYGGEALYCSDDFFAPVGNLVKKEPSKWIPDLMTERGKWMDSWETRRHNKAGVDWAIIKLGLPGLVYGVCVDTSHHSGNHAPEISVEGVLVKSNVGLSELLVNKDWKKIVPRSKCRGCYFNFFKVENNNDLPFTFIRLNMYPDGGIARLRVFGEVVPDFTRLRNDCFDLALVDNGGIVLAASNSHFSSKDNIIQKNVGRDMSDGWETARSRTLNHHEWLVLRLGHYGYVEEIEIDTRHFKGNYPDFCKIEGIYKPELLRHKDFQRDQNNDWSKEDWQLIVDKHSLFAHSRHFFKGADIKNSGPWSHVKLTIFPDGGVSRIRVFGNIHDPKDQTKRVGEVAKL